MKMKKNITILINRITSLMLGAATLFTINIINVSAEDTTAATTSEAEDETVPVYKSDDGEFSYVVNSKDDSYYTENSYVDNSCRIISYLGDDEVMKIPETIDGYTVTTITDNAFADLKTVREIDIPSTLNYIGASPFFDCASLEKFKVDENNKYFEAIDGVLISKDGETIYCYPSAKKGDDYVVPTSVEAIAPSCFAYAGIKNITLPSDLKEIYEWSFSYSGLEQVEFKDKLDKIDQFAFAYCTDLAKVTFNDGLTEIGSAAFADCGKIKDVTLPESLETVGQDAFLGTGLTSIQIPAGVTDIGYCAFGYDEEYRPIDNFIIYGYNGTQAQAYASDEDSDNDYKNDFTFSSLGETTQPATEESKSGINFDFLKNPNWKTILACIVIGLFIIAFIVVIAIILIKKVSKPKTKKKKNVKKDKEEK